MGGSSAADVTLELPVEGSNLATDEARLSIAVADEPLVDGLLLKRQPGGLLYRSADGQATFQFTQSPVLSATVQNSVHGYVTLPQVGWQGAVFSPLTETEVNSGVFTWSAEETYGDYWGWSVTVGDIGDVEATGPGEMHAYTVRLQGPAAMLNQVKYIHLGGHALPVVQQGGVFRVADALDSSRALTLAALPIDAVPPLEPNENTTISQEMAALPSGWSYEEQDVSREEQDSVMENLSKGETQNSQGLALRDRFIRQAGIWLDNQTNFGYYQGFATGFCDNVKSSFKDAATTVIGITNAASNVFWLGSPLGVAWEFTFGDCYYGEIKAATQAAKRAKEAVAQIYQVLTEWGPVVFEYLYNLQLQVELAVGQVLFLGDIPSIDKLGPELRLTLEVMQQILYLADDSWAGMTPYERGCWQGYIAAEIVVIVVSTLLSAEYGGVGGAAAMARHVPKLTRVLHYVIKLLDKLTDVPGLAKLVAKLRGFGKFVHELGSFCFVAGTPVLTAHGPRPIEQVEEGEWVWSRDENTEDWGWRPVTKTFTTHPDTLVHVSYAARGGTLDAAARAGMGDVPQTKPEGLGGESEIVCTQGHLIHARRSGGAKLAGFIAAGALLAGDFLTLADGRDAVVTEVRVEHAAEAELFTTYNFTVAGHHTYFAGTLPVWVHNDGLTSCDKVLNKMSGLIVKALGSGGGQDAIFQAAGSSSPGDGPQKRA